MTPEAFIEAVAEAASGRERLVVGIAGAPGAGKSTLAAAVAASLAARPGADAVVLPMDGFHLPQARLVELGRRDRMGAPDTFDVDGFAAVLGALRTPGGTRAPLFDRTIEEPQPGALEIGSGIRIVLVEGNYLLHDRDGWQRIAPLLDLSAFVHVDDAVRRERLIARHIEFGKTPEAARAWALGPDEANARLVAASRARAQLVVELD